MNTLIFSYWLLNYLSGVSLHCWPKLLHCMLSWEEPNHSSGISTGNSPCQEFASLGLICRQRNIFPCIFLRDLLTIPLEGINLCTSKIFLYNGCICYLTQLQHLWAHWKNYWPAVYQPLPVLFSRSCLQRWRGCQRLSENCKQPAILNFTRYVLHTSNATLTGWSGPTVSIPQSSRFSGDKMFTTDQAVIQNFFCALFPTDCRNPFV